MLVNGPDCELGGRLGVVESRVCDALQPVVQVGASLKIDLRTVRDEIKGGIKRIIEDLEVDSLGEKVKIDLGELRKKIVELKDKMDGGDSIVKTELDALRKAKGTLDGVTGQPSGSIHKAMSELDSKFKEQIQTPLSQKVNDVDTAIGTLGGNFGKHDKKLQEIFGHIKEKVGEIKGNGGSKKTGVDGIVARFETYVTEVGKNMANQTTVHSWLDKILTHNGVVVYRLGKLVDDNKGSRLNGNYNSEKGMHDPIKEKTKAKIQQAGVYRDAESESPVESNGLLTVMLTSLMKLIEAYASVLDDKINVVGNILQGNNNEFVTELVGMIEREIKNGSSRPDKKHLTPAVEATVAALTANARRTAGKINSLLLSDSGNVADMLDHITPIAKKLDTALKGATDPQPQKPPTGQPESPAQAVDSKLGEVRKMVTNEITGTFTSKVKKDLEDAVSKLPTAVEGFNTEAQKQIREAAKTAIKEAAGQFQTDGTGSDISVEKTMHKFHQAYDPIKKNLKSDLEQKVDAELPNADGTNASIHVKLDDTRKFGGYNTYVKQDNDNLKAGELTGKPDAKEGILPQAIGDIKTQVDSALNMIDPQTNGGTATINEKTFAGPFDEIKKELDEIARFG
ncbi:Extracellular matrix-binding ebh, putative [Babesia ovata]|uniref:Extracellular matrix-binding ebh, putative n=1 Tax=Babesia ovata TaxID=189622 RepID=A0A2H6K6D7_9APIC|nr:Extracellular matrix-binding ebh, putative [Babesia ovata]GBE58549.1 Extracellular matrix-binding ebh, putative [Babesia ovata]